MDEYEKKELLEKIKMFESRKYDINITKHRKKSEFDIIAEEHGVEAALLFSDKPKMSYDNTDHIKFHQEYFKLLLDTKFSEHQTQLKGVKNGR